MAKIPFTKQELTRAWREATKIANVNPRENPHRLLLFYAVECGLKAVYLKRNSLDVIDDDIASKLAHDINKIASGLLMRQEQLLPEGLSMKSCKIKNVSTTRNCHVSQLNQVWRYGGKLNDNENSNDLALEVKLVAMNQWIDKEL